MKNQKKKFMIKGWVPVEVYAEIEASSLRGAKMMVARQENKYGKGNGTLFDYEEGNWCGNVEIESIEEKE